MTVLVLTEEFDPTADRVVELLNGRGVPVFRMDTADFPQRLSVDARLDDDGWSGMLCTEHREVSLKDLRSIWYRRPTGFGFPDSLSEPERKHASAEARFGLGGVLSSLHVLWVNHPGREADAAYKPAQLAMARQCGLTVPRTLITNQPRSVEQFRDSLPGPLVTKLLGASAFVEAGNPKIVYTTKLADDDLTDLSGVTTTAHLFQEWVPKAYEVRVTVVGTIQLAAAIHTEAADALVDWRSNYDALSYRAVDVPSTVRDGVLAFMRAYGLTFGAFDFVVTPNDRWVMLECNPCGQFGWIEAAMGLPISDALADLLSRGSL